MNAERVATENASVINPPIADARRAVARFCTKAAVQPQLVFLRQRPAAITIVAASEFGCVSADCQRPRDFSASDL
jgi:hypothetical protein